MKLSRLMAHLLAVMLPATSMLTGCLKNEPDIGILNVNTPEPFDEKVSIGTADMPARNTMPLELYGLSESECEEWFSDAVFVGDSLTIGWKNYNNIMLQQNTKFFGETRFLCEGSYGVGHALEPVSENSLHPVYLGEQHLIWDSVKLIGAKKIFILFGMNDLTIWGVDGALENYTKVIDNINESNPDAEIFVISSMYMYKGSEREVLNNSNIYKFNRGLINLCNERGMEFINIASHLIDEEGYVPDEFSSDQYVHQTRAAYAVWAQVLRSLAARHILGYGAIVFE